MLAIVRASSLVFVLLCTVPNVSRSQPTSSWASQLPVIQLVLTMRHLRYGTGQEANCDHR